MALQDYSAGISFARRGLIANPTDSLLLNNLAFALANAGRLPEAVEAFSRIERAGLSPSMQVAYLATAGLLQYRAGLPEVGRTLYRRAIEFAEKGRLKRERAMAFLFFAREELSSASPTLSKVLEEARSARADLPSVDAALTEKLSKDLIRPDGGEVEES